MTCAHFECLTWLLLTWGYALADERAPLSKGQPPGFFQVTKIGKEAIELKGIGDAKYSCPISDLEVYDARGKKLTADDLHKRVKMGSVVVVASDENAVDPAYFSLLKEDTVVLVGVVVLVAQADNPGRGWTFDLKKMKPSEQALAGRVRGVDFKAEKVQLLNTGLSLQSGKDHIHMFLRLKSGEGIAGKSFEVNADEPPGPGVPAIHFHFHSTKPIGAFVLAKGYAMRLEFGKPDDGGVIAGKLYLCLPDESKSWIAGSFTLKLK